MSQNIGHDLDEENFIFLRVSSCRLNRRTFHVKVLFCISKTWIKLIFRILIPLKLLLSNIKQERLYDKDLSKVNTKFLDTGLTS